MPTTVRLSDAAKPYHNIYVARGRDRAGNTYADPTQTCPQMARYREKHNHSGH